MDLKKLFTDDDAVSPVIGVILMVAITVILAAVIASFVLGLGQDAGDNSPQASFDIEYNSGELLDTAASNDGSVSVTHQSGATIEAGSLFIRGSSLNQSDTGEEWYNQYASSGAAQVPETAGSDVSSGSTVNVLADNDYELRVVWQPPEEDTSSTLQTSEGPEA